MEARDQGKIREEVRETYGKVARAGSVSSGPSQTASCCGPSNTSAGAVVRCSNSARSPAPNASIAATAATLFQMSCRPTRKAFGPTAYEAIAPYISTTRRRARATATATGTSLQRMPDPTPEWRRRRAPSGKPLRQPRQQFSQQTR